MNVATLLFMTYFFNGFHISTAEVIYFLGIVLAISLVNYFSTPVIKFFTLKVRFITIWLFNFLLYIPLLYLANAFLPGIQIKIGNFVGMNFGIFQVNPFSLNDGALIVLAALVFGLGAAVIRWLLE
jgi:uncharacterized membrane protein YvlD (DUF360 family)